MGGLTIWIVTAVCAGLAAAGWIFVPKGDNQVILRNMIALTIACCWLMWAITYLAQLHPLVKPRRSDLRPGYRPDDMRFTR